MIPMDPTGPLTDATAREPVSADEALAALARVLESDLFRTAPVLQRFLRLLVERSLAGSPGAVKEYALGVDVFERGSDFDPRIDTIVRVEARRLRARLSAYYAGPGRGDPIRIDLPKGAYVVAFRTPPLVTGADTAPGPPAASLARDVSRACVLPPCSPLPRPRTPLIGREHDVAAVSALLGRDGVALVTLTGSGGSGKTSLALQVASEIACAGGVYFIALGAVTDPAAVGREIAHAVGVRHGEDGPLDEAIRDHLMQVVGHPTLLVVDNFEHLLGAAPLLPALLEACHLLKILVTSRAVLRVSGEHTYAVAPLAVPDLSERAPLDALASNPAVRLFVQRARAIAPAFTLDAGNAAAIAEICVRVDGLPLALELAAARMRVLTPTQICARMAAPLDLLTTGAADMPARQRTLRHTLEWSHALLTPEEQRLFRRLAVFSGGWTLEGVEAVCDTRRDLGVSAIDGMSSLIEQSLVCQIGETPAARRFAMLDTVREFAREQLDAHGEADAVRRAHAAYSVVLAEEVAVHNTPIGLADWLDQCDAEHADHRAALAYLLETGNASWALRLGVALYRYWEHREYLAEGRAWLDAILALPEAAAPTLERARALSYGASFAQMSGDHAVAFRRQRESLAAYRALGDRRGEIAQLNSLASTERFRGDMVAARDWSEQTVSACRALGDDAAIGPALSNFGGILLLLGHHDEARRRLEEAAAVFELVDDETGVAWCCNHLGDVAAERGELAEAARLYERGARIFQSMDNRWGLARSSCDLGHLACRQHRYDVAHGRFVDALQAFLALGHKRGMAAALEGLALLAADQARPIRALTLSGAATALRHATGAVARWEQDRKQEQTRDLATGQCDPMLADRAWTAGWRLPLDDLLAYAVTPVEAQEEPTESWRDRPAGGPPPRDPPAARPVRRGAG